MANPVLLGITHVALAANANQTNVAIPGGIPTGANAYALASTFYVGAAQTMAITSAAFTQQSALTTVDGAGTYMAGHSAAGKVTATGAQNISLASSIDYSEGPTLIIAWLTVENPDDWIAGHVRDAQNASPDVLTGTVTSQTGGIVLAFVGGDGGSFPSTPAGTTQVGSTQGPSSSDYQAVYSVDTVGAASTTVTMNSASYPTLALISAKAAGSGTLSIVPDASSSGATVASVAFVTPVMVDYFPDADISAGPWLPTVGGSLFGVTSEITPLDSDYAYALTNGTCELSLANAGTPGAGVQKLTYRLSGTADKALKIGLYQGGVLNEEWTTDPCQVAVAEYIRTLSAGVTNGSDLSVKFQMLDATSPPLAQVVHGSTPTGASGTTSAAATYPTGISAATSKLLCVVTGRSNTANTAPTMPAGWTNVLDFEGGTGTWGVDAGTRRVTVFQKDTVVGDETGTVTVSLAGTTSNTLRATIIRVEIPENHTLSVAASTGADTTSATGFSATGSTTIDFAPNDLLLIVLASSSDTVTQSAQSITAAGITFGTRTNRASVAVTNGNDHRHVFDTVPVTAGNATVAPTYAYTGSAAVSGPVGFLRLRAVPPTPGAAVTWLKFSAPEPASGGSTSITPSASSSDATVSTVSLSQTHKIASTAASSGASVSPVSLIRTPNIRAGYPVVATAAAAAPPYNVLTAAFSANAGDELLAVAIGAGLPTVVSRNAGDTAAGSLNWILRFVVRQNYKNTSLNAAGAYQVAFYTAIVPPGGVTERALYVTSTVANEGGAAVTGTAPARLMVVAVDNTNGIGAIAFKGSIATDANSNDITTGQPATQTIKPFGTSSLLLSAGWFADGTAPVAATDCIEVVAPGTGRMPLYSKVGGAAGVATALGSSITNGDLWALGVIEYLPTAQPKPARKILFLGDSGIESTHSTLQIPVSVQDNLAPNFEIFGQGVWWGHLPQMKARWDAEKATLPAIDVAVVQCGGNDLNDGGGVWTGAMATALGAVYTDLDAAGIAIAAGTMFGPDVGAGAPAGWYDMRDWITANAPAGTHLYSHQIVSDPATNYLTMIAANLAADGSHVSATGNALFGANISAWINTLSFSQTIVPQAASSGASASTVSVAQTHKIVPTSASSGASVATVTVAQTHKITPTAANSGASVATVTVAQTHKITPTAASSGASVATASVAQTHKITPTVASSGASVASVALASTSTLNPQAASSGASVSAVNLLQTHKISVTAASSGGASASATIVQTHKIAQQAASAGASVSSVATIQGFLGSTILAASGLGDHGPGILYNDMRIGDDAKRYFFIITRMPTNGTLDIDPIGTFTYTGSSDSFDYDLYENNVNLGSATVSLELGLIINPSSSSSGATSNTVAIVQTHKETLTTASSGASVSSVALIQTHKIAPIPASSGETAANVTVGQTHIILPTGSNSQATVQTVSLNSSNQIAPQASQSGVSVATVSVSQTHTLQVVSASAGATSGTVALSQIHKLQPQVASSDAQVSSVALIQTHVIAPTVSNSGAIVYPVDLTGTAIIYPSPAQSDATVLGVTIKQTHIINPTDAESGVTALQVLVSQLHLIEVTQSILAATVATVQIRPLANPAINTVTGEDIVTYTATDDVFVYPATDDVIVYPWS